MMENTPRKYAIVDLEATGAHASASIIQIGIVIIQDNQIVNTYQTDINPHQKLSEHIIHLTGITDAQLGKAPDFSQVAKDIYELIADCTFVAHNVKFDANLLAEQLFLEGFELRTPRVDTVELAQVFYPTFEKYSLTDLSKLLNLELSDAHTAIADAMATAQLFLKLKKKIASLPKETLEKILSLADNLLFETRLVIEEGFEKAQLLSNQTHHLVGGLVLKQEEEQSFERHLSNCFEVNMGLLGLDAREKQIVFAEMVEKSFEKSLPTFLEAQAGLGKTYGYLLPLLKQAHNEQVIVSVPTKVLQDQISSNEMKKIREVFQISCHSLKGPRNYIKLDSFYDNLASEGDNHLVNRYKMQILVWLTETDTGDLDEIKQKQRFEAYFDRIKHDGKLSKKSLFYDVDFWQRSYEKARHSRLLLTNHAYFLERVQDDKAFAQGKILVFDEAQRLFLNLENFSRKQVNLTQILLKMEKQLVETNSLLEQRLLESLSFDLSQAILSFHRNQKFQLSDKQIASIKQALSELTLPELAELQDCFQDYFSDFWLESRFENEKRTVYLNAASQAFLNFKDFLPETRKTYLISATLQISPRVSVAELLGFENYEFLSIPKEKNPNQKIWIDDTMPSIDEVAEEEYVREIVNRLLTMREIGQPILVLFNAKKMMLQVSEILDGKEIRHLTQEKNGSAYNVKRRFDRGETSILLGTGSFWEGVDFVHADKIIEVIVRLPFDNPGDMFMKKMSDHLLAQCKSPFYDYSLPLAILRIKQAVGRTMRRKGQKSAVLILDKRIFTKTYGQIIHKALNEEFYLSNQKSQNCMLEIANFLV